MLFCDLVGSATISEALDPEALRDLLTAYYRCCSQSIERFGGQIAKYVGDGIDAYFGYPVAQEDAATRAVLAALQITQEIKALNSRMGTDGAEIKVRIGIHSGVVVTGTIGEGTIHKELGIVGDVPVIASRLQTVARPGDVLVSQSTKQLVERHLELHYHGSYRLKGVEEPVKAYVAPLSNLSLLSKDGEIAISSRPPQVPTNRFVGREAEISIILESWQRSLESEGQAVLVTGEPGIGKTRMIHAAAASITGDKPSIIQCLCSPYLTNSALHPFVELLRQDAGFAPGDSDTQMLDKLEAFLARSSEQALEDAPYLASLMSLPREERYGLSASTSAQERLLRQEAIIRQIALRCRAAPLLMIVEDIHWADPSTLDLLQVLIARLQPLRLLLIMTARPEFVPPWSVSGHVASLSLGRLNRDRMASMIENLAGPAGLPQDLRDSIIQRAGGIPLFIEELTRHLMETLALSKSGGEKSYESRLKKLPIPATLQDSLMARLDHLAQGKIVAQTAAAIGRSFSYELLAALVPLPQEQLEDALAELTESGLVFQRGFGEDASFEFKHVLVQSVAHESLLHSKRRELHRRIAEKLSAFGDRFGQTPPEVLAYHYEEAEDFGQAVTYYNEAGEQASARSSYVEAINHFETAISLTHRLSDRDERLRRELGLLSHLRNALVVAKGYSTPGVERACSRSRDLCERLRDDRELFAVLWNLTGFYMVRGEHETTVPLNDRLLEIADAYGDRELQIMAKDTVGQTLFYLGRFEEAQAHFDHAIELYDPAQDEELCKIYAEEDPLVTSLAFNALIDVLTDAPDRAVQTAQRSLEIGRQLPYELTQALAASYYARVQSFRRDYRETHLVSEAMSELCVEKGIAYYLASAKMMKGWSQVLGVNDPGGHEVLLEGIRIGQESGAAVEHSFSTLLRAESCLALRLFDEGIEAVDSDIALSERTKEDWCRAETFRLKAELLSARDRRNEDEALSLFKQASDIAAGRGQWLLQLRAACSWAKVLIEKDLRDEARSLIRPVYSRFSEG
ncbi:MAG TPA: adenylate/guanylate cyclase domain-containing protein, partial [Kiloniellaceae bacterium]|nr:adenylate/guanylate cyclase domain-containing protein [Kiloniellaceae bacterium]